MCLLHVIASSGTPDHRRTVVSHRDQIGRARPEAAPGSLKQRPERGMRRGSRSGAAGRGPRRGRRSASACPRAGMATAKRGSPCWRVPRISPSPRRPRSISASLKPSLSRGNRLEPAARHRTRPFGEETGSGTRALRTHPAAQLVQLGDAVALGPLDQHHRRVGDVDPDLDHRGRDQDVGLRRRRTPPSPRPFGAACIWPWTTPIAQAAKLLRRQARGLRLGRLPLLSQTPPPAGRRRRPAAPRSAEPG